MPGWRISMRKIRELLRLKFEQGLTNRQIARSCSISRPSVAHYLARAAEAGIACPPIPYYNILFMARDKIVFNMGERTGNIWMAEIKP
jgi:hypothetical protein